MTTERDAIDDIAEVIFDYIPEKARAMRAKIRELLTGKKEEKSPVKETEYFFQKEMTFDNKVWNLSEGGKNIGGLSFYLESEDTSLDICFNNAVHSHEAVHQVVKWPLESRKVEVVFDSGLVQLKLKIVTRENGPIMLFLSAVVAE